VGRLAVLRRDLLPPGYRVVDWSGDLAYTVGFEEGEVRVDGGPPSPMTLRVTHVLRRIDGEWRLVHRHADHPPCDERPQPAASVY